MKPDWGKVVESIEENQRRMREQSEALGKVIPISKFDGISYIELKLLEELMAPAEAPDNITTWDGVRDRKYQLAYNILVWDLLKLVSNESGIDYVDVITALVRAQGELT